MIYLDDADSFAANWHDGQLRKYTNEPYIEHPRAVRRLVESVCSDTGVLMAALFHDLIEDTECTALDIERNFGWEVAALTLQLTDFSQKKDGNRATRKSLDRRHIARGTYASKTIKIADLIDNSKTILVYDPDFARVYLREKRLLLDECLKEGNFELWHQADEIVRKGLNELQARRPGDNHSGE